MADLGVKVLVNTGQVVSAKKEVDALNKELDETGKKSLTPGGEGLEESSGLIRKMTEDIRKMRGLATKGERQGGLLDKQQLQDATRLSKQVTDNMSAYSKALSNARSEMGKLIREKVKLDKKPKGFESPTEFIQRQERSTLLGSQIKAYRSQYDFGKKERQFEGVRGRYGEQAERLGGMGAQGKDWMGMGKKMLGPLAGVLTAGAIYKYLGAAGKEFETFSAEEAALKMRGGTGGAKASLGYTPIESLRLSGALGKTTGMGGVALDLATEMAKEFSRSVGIETSTTAGFAGGTYQATGWQGKELKEQLTLLRDTATALGARGRIEEIMQGSQQLLVMAAKNTGGAAVTAEEAQNLNKLQMYLESLPGMIGKGQSGIDMLAQLNRGITSGGQGVGGRLFMQKALGADKVGTAQEMWEFRGQMEKGLQDPENLKGILDLAYKQWGKGKEGGLSVIGKSHLSAMFGELSTKQADILGTPGFREMVNKAPSQALEALKKEKDAPKRLAKYEGKLAVTSPMETAAEAARLQVEAGEPVSTVTDAMKTLKNVAIGSAVGEKFRGVSGGFSTADIAEKFELQKTEGKSEENSSKMVEQQEKTNMLLEKIVTGGMPGSLPLSAPSVSESHN